MQRPFGGLDGPPATFRGFLSISLSFPHPLSLPFFPSLSILLCWFELGTEWYGVVSNCATGRPVRGQVLAQWILCICIYMFYLNEAIWSMTVFEGSKREEQEQKMLGHLVLAHQCGRDPMRGAQCKPRVEGANAVHVVHAKGDHSVHAWSMCGMHFTCDTRGFTYFWGCIWQMQFW